MQAEPYGVLDDGTEVPRLVLETPGLQVAILRARLPASVSRRGELAYPVPPGTIEVWDRGPAGRQACPVSLGPRTAPAIPPMLTRDDPGAAMASRSAPRTSAPRGRACAQRAPGPD